MQDLSALVAAGKSKLSNPDIYLTSFMAQVTPDTTDPQWQLHFYNPLEDTVYTYDAETGEIEGPSDVLKKEDFVPELDIAQVRVSFEEALKKALEEAAPEREFVRIIVLLQTIDDDAVWNITFMNKQYHALNIRLDAGDAHLIKKEPFQLFHYDQK